MPDHAHPPDNPGARPLLADHALKKPLKVLDVWALGVGVVITGEYFGWNFALKDNGPVAVLVASLIVCLLYLTWVLALSELSVAMPFAGGPLAYGRRAAGPAMGFVMGWSMFLECQFATITTALATGGYIAFLLNPAAPSDTVAVWAALATVVIFFVLHVWGVKEQSTAMVWMTYGAILGLVIFWCLAATNFRWDRVWTNPLFPAGKGWRAVLDAVPYALWWLVMIETVALAAEEAHQPHRTIPRGLVWSQLTLIVLVVLTWLFACGAVDDTQALGDITVGYPLAKVVAEIPVGRSPWAIYGFGLIALFGMIASYHGMVYGTSRQAFALGRAGYLPGILGKVHSERRTPVPSLALCSLVTAAFVVANLKYKEAIAVALLVSTLTALVWYVLAITCLFILRKREPELFQNYRAPVARVLPVAVVVLSIFAAVVYVGIDIKVLPITAALYAVGLIYYFAWSRSRLKAWAPEESSARQARVPEEP
ncbi:MAG: amino acid permease [Planctomycetia bacterium]|nr:amino acid permease [Planctomycetia bacterium]